MKRITLLILICFITSCDKTFISSIPDWPVSLEFDLDFQDKELNNPMAYKIITPQNITQESQRNKTGFGGVLIYHGSSFFAFDAACPHEAKQNTIVSLDKEGLSAICPECGSKYDLYEGFGNRVSGPSKEDLKRYRVFPSGNKIIVHN